MAQPTVLRRAYLHFGPSAPQESLVEAPVDRFELEQSFDSISEDGARWEVNMRSPANGLLLNPKLYFQFDVVLE